MGGFSFCIHSHTDTWSTPMEKLYEKLIYFMMAFRIFFLFVFYDIFLFLFSLFSLLALFPWGGSFSVYYFSESILFSPDTVMSYFSLSSSFSIFLLFYMTDFLHSCEMRCFALYFRNFQALSSTSEARNRIRRASMRTILCDIRQGRKRLFYFQLFPAAEKKRLSDGALCARDFRPSVFNDFFTYAWHQRVRVR